MCRDDLKMEINKHKIIKEILKEETKGLKLTEELKTLTHIFTYYDVFNMLEKVLIMYKPMEELRKKKE